MAVVLMGLHITHEVNATTREGGVQTQRRDFSENSFRADLMLTPDGDESLRGLGFVRLTVEAQPTALPAMNPDETLVWLRETLKKML